MAESAEFEIEIYLVVGNGTVIVQNTERGHFPIHNFATNIYCLRMFVKAESDKLITATALAKPAKAVFLPQIHTD
jgi:hypothetical protein